MSEFEKHNGTQNQQQNVKTDAHLPFAFTSALATISS
jgi:hypothetical protein